jgi:hypothetical protein
VRPEIIGVTYVFRHVVAEMGNPHWRPIQTELIPVCFRRDDLGVFWIRFRED